MTITKTELKLLEDVSKLGEKYPENTTLHTFIIDEVDSILEYDRCGYNRYDRLLHHVQILHKELDSYKNVCRLKRDNAKLEKLKKALQIKLQEQCNGIF